MALATTFIYNLSQSPPDHRMEKKFMNKCFIDIICNQVWSLSCWLKGIIIPEKGRMRGKRSSTLLPPGWLGQGLGREGTWTQRAPFEDSQPTEWGLLCFPNLCLGRNCMGTWEIVASCHLSIFTFPSELSATQISQTLSVYHSAD